MYSMLDSFLVTLFKRYNAKTKTSLHLQIQKTKVPHTASLKISDVNKAQHRD